MDTTRGTPPDTTGQGPDGSGDEVPENVFNENVSQQGDIYYLENFNSGMEDWEYFFVQGEDADVFNESRDGVFHAELTANDTFLYYTFKGWDFSDIRLDSRVENLGVENNNVGLACWLTEDGWYEANILGNGDFFVYHYDANANEDKYKVLQSGNTGEINTGNNVNDLTLICQGSQLSFGVNDVELVSLALDADGHQVIEWGQVGMTVASEEETPVIVDFHASTTAEKYTMFYHLDGKVAAVLGSHTKVLTADARILPGGTAVIAGTGRTGSRCSVGGLEPEIEIRKFLTQIHEQSRVTWKDLELQGVLVETNEEGKAVAIEIVREACEAEDHEGTGNSQEG